MKTERDILDRLTQIRNTRLRDAQHAAMRAEVVAWAHQALAAEADFDWIDAQLDVAASAMARGTFWTKPDIGFLSTVEPVKFMAEPVEPPPAPTPEKPRGMFGRGGKKR